jgi:hypothetical protein
MEMGLRSAMMHAMKTSAGLRLAAVIVACGGLSACAGADRFAGGGIGSRPFGQARAEPALPPSPPITSAPVEVQALPPPPGASQAPSVAPPVGSDVLSGGAQPDPLFQPPDPTTPLPAPRQIETPTLSGGARDVAVLGGSERPTGRGPVTGRDGVIGSWTAREATGGNCRVQLSSSPALDLYRANASGCSNRELARVTAWDYRDGEVYLYQPGGSVAARLKVNDGSSLNGVIARSGAQLSMSR